MYSYCEQCFVWTRRPAALGSGWSGGYTVCISYAQHTRIVILYNIMWYKVSGLDVPAYNNISGSKEIK